MRFRDLLTHRCIAAASLAVMAVACSSGGKPEVKNPEAQSNAEYDLAKDFFNKGENRKALDHIQTAVSYNEDNDKAHYLHAIILMSFCSGPRGFEAPDCRMADAEAAGRAALKANPDFRDAKNLVGQILINEKKYKDAIVVLEPLTKDPAYISPQLAWGNLGWAQVENGQVDAGIASLRNAVASEPRFCLGHYHLAQALEKKGDNNGAEQSYSSAISADPRCADFQDAWAGRAEVRAKLGKSGDSRQDYEQCAKISKETQTGKTCVQALGSSGSLLLGSSQPESRKT